MTPEGYNPARKMNPTTDNTRCPVPGCQLRIEHTHEQTDFCHACGAHVPPAIGEGTCPRCPDPTGLNPLIATVT